MVWLSCDGGDCNWGGIDDVFLCQVTIYNYKYRILQWHYKYTIGYLLIITSTQIITIFLLAIYNVNICYY